MSEMTENQKHIDRRLNQAKFILKKLGLAPAQCNNRSGYVFLALANVTPDNIWNKAESRLLPIHLINKFLKNYYKKEYDRESIRKDTLHQFEQVQIVQRNRDDPLRSTSSAKNNYSLNQIIIDILHQYPGGNWQTKLEKYHILAPVLDAKYEKDVDSKRIPIKFPDDTEIFLSPGMHNQLHADIIHEFCTRFIEEGGHILYIGDTASSRNEGGRSLILKTEYLKKLGIVLSSHSKLPDVVIHDELKNRLFIIEAVTSSGPVSQKRLFELKKLFSNCTTKIEYITAFPDYKEFKKHIADIAWETKVWLASQPNHIIHFKNSL